MGVTLQQHAILNRVDLSCGLDKGRNGDQATVAGGIPVRFICQRKDVGSLEAPPYILRSAAYRPASYDAPATSCANSITKRHGAGCCTFRRVCTSECNIIGEAEGTCSDLAAVDGKAWKRRTAGNNVVTSSLEGIVIFLNHNTALISESQGVAAMKNKYDIDHRVEIGICHAVSENKTTEHHIRIVRIVNMNVAPVGAIGGLHSLRLG
jgi:hypothetical protein